jgi:hypothetical protein
LACEFLACEISGVGCDNASRFRGTVLPALRHFAHLVEAAHTDVIETHCAFLQTVDA